MTQPWFKARVRGWPTVRESLTATKSWNEDLIWTDLEWWSDQVKQGREKQPGAKRLAKEWGMTEWAVRQMLKSLPDDMFPPRKPRAAPAQPPRDTRATGDDEQRIQSEYPRNGRADSAQAPRKVRDTRTLTEQQSNRATEDTVLVAQGSTAAPEPLWVTLGCPPPGDTVKSKDMTARVLEIYASWWKRYDAWCKTQPGRRNTFHEIHVSDLNAIKSALKRRPSGIVGPDAVDQWPIDRLVKATLAAPMAFPEGHDRAWTRKKGGWMRPSFTLRNGTTRNQWEEAAKAAVELAEQGSPTLRVVSGARDDSTASQGPLRLPSAEAVAGRLWSVYLSASPSARRSVAGILGRDDLWDSWLATSQGVIPMGEALSLSEWDAKFRRKDYVRAVADWARREGVAS